MSNISKCLATLGQLKGVVDNVKNTYPTKAEVKALVGTPLIAATAADMIDHSKIYVYTGSQTGYNNGHWYYWNGSAWADGGVYNAVAVDTDKTLSIENKAADAKKTGDELSSLKSDINGSVVQGIFDNDLQRFANNTGYIKPDGVTYDTNANYNFSDYIEIPVSAEQIKIGAYAKVGGNAVYLPSCCFFYDSNKTLISSVSGAAPNIYAIADIPTTAKYVRFNRISETANSSFVDVVRGFWFLPTQKQIIEDNTLKNTVQLSFDGNLEELANELYLLNTDGTLGNSANYVHSDFVPIPNGAESVLIGAYFVTGSASYYLNPAVLFYDDTKTYLSSAGGTAQKYAHYAIPAGAKYLRFNQVRKDGTITTYTSGLWFSPTISERLGETYYVGGDSGNTSFTKMLLDLKDNENEKTIIVYGADYDVFAEYKALQQAGLIPSIPESGVDPIQGFTPYNVFVPKNTHIIGEGIVRLLYMPEAADTYESESKALSPINTAATCTIENVEIHCKNGRYCVHDEVLQNADYIGAKHYYKNVKMIKYAPDDTNLGTLHAFGCGIGREMYFEFDNCYIETQSTDQTARGLYFHNRKTVGGVNLTVPMSSNIFVKNCIMKSAAQNLSMYLGNIGGSPDVKIRVDIANCFVDGNIVSADEDNWQLGTNGNTFAIRVLNCKYNQLIIRRVSNPYPAEVYSFTS